MEITKNTDKPHIISYTRNDNSKTWMHASEYFVRHDLSHYALEKALGYTTAFMGMLNNGMDIHDFENREKRLQHAITAEGYYAENMANLFLMEVVQGEMDNFNDVAATAFAQMNTVYPAPWLTTDQLHYIRSLLRQLLQQWQQLPAGNTLSLLFDL